MDLENDRNRPKTGADGTQQPTRLSGRVERAATPTRPSDADSGHSGGARKSADPPIGAFELDELEVRPEVWMGKAGDPWPPELIELARAKAANKREDDAFDELMDDSFPGSRVGSDQYKAEQHARNVLYSGQLAALRTKQGTDIGLILGRYYDPNPDRTTRLRPFWRAVWTRIEAVLTVEALLWPPQAVLTAYLLVIEASGLAVVFAGVMTAWLLGQAVAKGVEGWYEAKLWHNFADPSASEGNAHER